MTREDWVDWKRQEITQRFFGSIADAIKEAEWKLGRSAGVDSSADRFIVGMIYAFEQVLNSEPTQVEGAHDD